MDVFSFERMEYPVQPGVGLLIRRIMAQERSIRVGPGFYFFIQRLGIDAIRPGIRQGHRPFPGLPVHVAQCNGNALHWHGDVKSAASAD